MIKYAGILLTGTFISAISQVLLKKSALKKYDSVLLEYLNPEVFFAYLLFVIATLMSVIAYKGIPLSMGPLLEATGYIYITIFGIAIFKEKMNRRKLMALICIVMGIAFYSVF